MKTIQIPKFYLFFMCLMAVCILSSGYSVAEPHERIIECRDAIEDAKNTNCSVVGKSVSDAIDCHRRQSLVLTWRCTSIETHLENNRKRIEGHIKSKYSKKHGLSELKEKATGLDHAYNNFESKIKEAQALKTVVVNDMAAFLVDLDRLFKPSFDDYRTCITGEANKAKVSSSPRELEIALRHVRRVGAREQQRTKHKLKALTKLEDQLTQVELSLAGGVNENLEFVDDRDLRTNLNLSSNIVQNAKAYLNQRLTSSQIEIDDLARKIKSKQAHYMNLEVSGAGSSALMRRVSNGSGSFNSTSEEMFYLMTKRYQDEFNSPKVSSLNRSLKYLSGKMSAAKELINLSVQCASSNFEHYGTSTCSSVKNNKSKYQNFIKNGVAQDIRAGLSLNQVRYHEEYSDSLSSYIKTLLDSNDFFNAALFFDSMLKGMEA